MITILTFLTCLASLALLVVVAIGLMRINAVLESIGGTGELPCQTASWLARYRERNIAFAGRCPDPEYRFRGNWQWLDRRRCNTWRGPCSPCGTGGPVMSTLALTIWITTLVVVVVAVVPLALSLLARALRNARSIEVTFLTCLTQASRSLATQRQ